VEGLVDMRRLCTCALVASCTATSSRWSAEQHGLSTLIPHPVAASQISANVTYVLYFVPIAGNTHSSLSSYAMGLNASCTKMRGDGLATVFAGDHSFIYANRIESCFPIVANSPQALNFTWAELPFGEVTASMPDDCSLKTDGISRHSHVRMGSGLFKRIARVYLSKVDVICNAAAALGDSNRPTERFALVDAKIGAEGHTPSGQEVLNIASYTDATTDLPAEDAPAPGTLRTQLYGDVLLDLGLAYTGFMNDQHEGFRPKYFAEFAKEAVFDRMANTTFYARCPNITYMNGSTPLDLTSMAFEFVIAKMLVVAHSGHELMRQRFHHMVTLMQQHFSCPCFDEEMSLTIMRILHPKWIRAVRLQSPF